MTPPSIAASIAAGLCLFLGFGPLVRADDNATHSTAASLRALRLSGKPGWRRAAISLLERHGTNSSSVADPAAERTALLQEAVTLIGTSELFAESWKPATESVSAILDLEGACSLELDAAGVLSVRDLATGAVRRTKAARAVPDQRVVRFHPATGWVALIDREHHWSFRSWTGDPGDFTGDPVSSDRSAWVSFHPEVQRVALPSSVAGSVGLALSPMPPRDASGVRQVGLPAASDRFEFSPSGTRLAALVPGESALWMIQPSLDRVQERIALEAPPVDLSWMPDARHVVVAGSNAVWTVDAQEGSVQTVTGNLRGITALALNESGLLLAVACDSGRLELWDFKAVHPLLGIRVGDAAIQRIQWDPKSSRLAVTLAGDPLPRLIGVSLSRDVVRFVPRGETVLQDSGGTPTLRLEGHHIWIRRDSGDEIELPAPTDLKSAAVSPNGAWVHLRGEDGAVTEWNLPRLRERLKRLGLAW